MVSWNQHIEDGTVAVKRADYMAAEKSLLAALQLAKANGKSDSRLALTLSLLGHVYFHMGDFPKAEKLLEQSLRLHSESTSVNDPCWFMDLFSLAEIKQAVGKDAEACKLYDDTLAKLQKAQLKETSKAKQAADVFKELSERASMRVSKEHRKPALPPPALEKRTGENGKLDDVWQQQFQTGVQSMKTEEPECDELITAYLNLESAYRLSVSLFPQDDMRVIATIKALADASTKLQIFDQAERLYRRAIENSKNNPNFVAAAGSLNLALALMHIEAGQFAQAQVIFSEHNFDNLPAEAEPLKKRISEAKKLIQVFNSTVEILTQAQSAEETGDLERASKLANNALLQLKQGFPPNHLTNVRVLRYRASVLERQGHPEMATELEERADRIMRADQAKRAEWARLAEELPRVEMETARV